MVEPILGSRKTVSRRYSRDVLIRRLVDPEAFTLSLSNHIGITAHLSESFRIVKRSGSRNRHIDGQVAQVFVDTPAEVTSVAVSGACTIIQWRVPIKHFEVVAQEDHDAEGNFLRLQNLEGTIDPIILRLLLLAHVHPEAQEESMRAVVAHLLARQSPMLASGTTRWRAGLAPSSLRRVKDLVEADLIGANLASMAKETSLSPFHFAREFRRATGQTPWSYVIFRRAARALVLLGQQTPTLAEIASETGFTHVSHLNHHLRSMTGLTAARLRMTMAGQQVIS